MTSYAVAGQAVSDPSKDPMTDAIKAPSTWLMLLEARAPWEMAAVMFSLPWLLSQPNGDGHPVLVLPGLAANDLTTIPLRSFLRSRGYAALPWNFGLNFGPRPGVLAGCVEHVRELARDSGQKVSVVGWSLGGIYAREIAKAVPDQVRCVITLGTPFDGPIHATNASWLFEFLSKVDPANIPNRAQIRQTPPVPTTSIISRTDGVVPWQCSINPATERSETIEIHASHTGMGANPLALYAIADRLAQRPGHWRPFHLDGVRRRLFRIGHEPIINAEAHAQASTQASTQTSAQTSAEAGTQADSRASAKGARASAKGARTSATATRSGQRKR